MSEQASYRELLQRWPLMLATLLLLWVGYSGQFCRLRWIFDRGVFLRESLFSQTLG